VIILKYFLEAQILNIHDLNTNLNYLSLNVLSLYCIFDVQNLALCLNRELIKIKDYKIISLFPEFILDNKSICRVGKRTESHKTPRTKSHNLYFYPGGQKVTTYIFA
jgi:hypothetical protein